MAVESMEMRQWPNGLEHTSTPPSASSNNGDFVVAEEGNEIHLLDSNLRYVPWCWRYKDSPPEASGLAIDSFTRATIAMSSLFLGPALLELSFQAAGCEADDQDCDARIYGMKPSSLLSNVALVTGLVVPATMPFFGACVDHTSYRKEVGMYVAFVLTAIKGVEIMVSTYTWFLVAMLQVVSGLLYQAHLIATLAYTCELSTDFAVQTRYNNSYSIVFSVGCFFFLLVVMGTAVYLDLDDVGTARVSQTTTTLVGASLFPAIWFTLFRPRPALSAVPPGQTLLSAGFRKIISSTRTIIQDLPALWYLMLSIMFTESASNALVAVATTYMKNILSMDGTQIGLVFFLALMTGIVGAKVGEFLSLKFNPIVSTHCLILLYILITLAASLLLTGPDHTDRAYLFGALWGIPLGGLQAQNQIIMMTIIPRGQEAEMMGSYIFCGQVLSWLPPLVFTIINEFGLPMAVGLSSLNLFFVIGSILLVCVGDYEKARRHAKAISDRETTSIPHEGLSTYPGRSSEPNPSLVLPSVT